MVLAKVLPMLVWIIFGSGSLVYAVLADEYDRMLIFKEPVSNKALKGHVIRSEMVSDDGSCRLKCYLEPNCVSINLGPRDKGNHVCELNSATEESASHSAMEERQGYTYYSVENPCHSNPCCGRFRHTVCQVGFTDKGFRCVNREGREEKQCDPFQCPSTWIAFEGSCYKLFTDEKDWNSAEAFCNAEGAQLVKIENADENDFIKKEFLIGKADYWIGLTDARAENDWEWSDGCKMTGYTKWRAGQPNGYNEEDCVTIKIGNFNGYGNDGQWHDEACTYTKGFICEK